MKRFTLEFASQAVALALAVGLFFLALNGWTL